MPLYISVAVLFLLIGVFFAVKKFRWMKGAEESIPEVQKQKMQQELESLEQDDFERDFFERCDNGEESVMLMKIASQQECAVFRSLLYSAGIPSYIESRHSSGIYGSAADVNIGLISVKLYVLKDDAEEAREIAAEFFGSQKNNCNPES